MKPYVILINIVTFGWFIALCFFRFVESGRACSGEFLDENALPKDYGTIYLSDQGMWLMLYVILQVVVWLVCKITALVVTNKLAAEFDEKKAMLS